MVIHKMQVEKLNINQTTSWYNLSYYSELLQNELNWNTFASKETKTFTSKQLSCWIWSLQNENRSRVTFYDHEYIMNVTRLQTRMHK